MFEWLQKCVRGFSFGSLMAILFVTDLSKVYTHFRSNSSNICGHLSGDLSSSSFVDEMVFVLGVCVWGGGGGVTYQHDCCGFEGGSYGPCRVKFWGQILQGKYVKK